MDADTKRPGEGGKLNADKEGEGVKLAKSCGCLL